VLAVAGGLTHHSSDNSISQSRDRSVQSLNNCQKCEMQTILMEPAPSL
jgi:hypothetical protein